MSLTGSRWGNLRQGESTMRYSDKPAGMTLAEALGIRVPDTAPGGSAPIPTPEDHPLVVRSTRFASDRTDYDYEGGFR